MTTIKVRFIEHPDKHCGWEWRLLDDDGRIMLNSVDFYLTREEAVKDFNKVRAAIAVGSANLHES